MHIMEITKYLSVIERSMVNLDSRPPDIYDIAINEQRSSKNPEPVPKTPRKCQFRGGRSMVNQKINKAHTILKNKKTLVYRSGTYGC
jgi:hypothetical protein